MFLQCIPVFRIVFFLNLEFSKKLKINKFSSNSNESETMMNVCAGYQGNVDNLMLRYLFLLINVLDLTASQAKGSPGYSTVSWSDN